MMIHRRRSVALWVVCWALALVFAVSLAPTAGAPMASAENRRGGILKVAIPNQPSNLDPTKPINFIGRKVLENVVDRLVRLDEKLKAQPELAVSWKAVSATEYVFTLRRGVKYHDGTDFNAQAVKAYFDHILDSNTRSPRRSNFTQIAEVQVVDDYTVRFVLSAPFAPFLAQLSEWGFMISPTQLARSPQTLAEKPIGTGPYRVDRWVRDDHVRLVRNPNYWEAGLPYLDEIIFEVIPDGAVRVTNLRTGRVHIAADVPARDVQSLKDDAKFKIAAMPAPGYRSFYLNTAAPPFDDRRVRQAFAHAIDRDVLVKTVAFGFGTPSYGPIAPRHFAYNRHFEPYKGRDPQRAAALLADAGKSNGVSFTVKLSNSPEELRMAQAVQEQIRPVGMDMRIDAGESVAKTNEVIRGAYEAFYAGFLGGPDPDSNTYDSFHSRGSFNWMKYQNVEVDRLLDGARSELVQEKRRQLYRLIEEILARDSPMVFVKFPYLETDGHVLLASVQDLVPIPQQRLLLKRVWLRR